MSVKSTGKYAREEKITRTEDLLNHFILKLLKKNKNKPTESDSLMLFSIAYRYYR